MIDFTQKPGDRTFEQWMAKVDAHIAKAVGGLTSEDLPDYCYRDAFDNRESPSACARKAVRAARS